MSETYILDGHTPVAAQSIKEWGEWMKTGNRRVAQTTVDDVTVSTVFLGLDHNFGGGEPLLFETVIFGGDHDQDQWRCSTWEQAEQQHQEACSIAWPDVQPLHKEQP